MERRLVSNHNMLCKMSGTNTEDTNGITDCYSQSPLGNHLRCIDFDTVLDSKHY